MNAKTFLLLATFFALFGTLAIIAFGCSGDDDDDSGSSGDDAMWDDDNADDDDTDDDNASGNLIWQDPPSSDYMTWEEAKTYCNDLTFDGHDDWRLPTISELRSLIRGCDGTELGGACGVTDDCLDSTCWNEDACQGCDELAGPGSGGAYWPNGMSGEITWYWSSSLLADASHAHDAWYVGFHYGVIADYYGDDVLAARCVRP